MSDDTFLPDDAAFNALRQLPDDGPVIMLNLLEFADDGGEAYRRYGRIALPGIEKRGGAVLYSGTPLMSEGATGQWDQVIIVSYPSRAAFLDMMADPAYRSGLQHRTAGLKRTQLHSFKQSDGTDLPLQPIQLGTGDAATDEIFVLNLLRFKKPGGRTAFESYGEVVRPMIAQRGGGPVLNLEGELPLVSDESWEQLILVRYPAISTLQEMVSTPNWQAANEDRQRGLDLTWAFPTRPGR
jgi:uncharacterized protein (DUF1330 family)